MLAAVAAAFGVVAVAGAVLVGLYAAVERQAARDETRPADVAIVLGSAVGPGGRPSVSLRVRTQHAIALYRAGQVQALFLSGGVGRFPPSEAEVMRRLAVAAGVPEAALVLDETAGSTQESMANAAREARARGWRTALVVSEPFHMLRARTMARDAGLAAYASPAPGSPLQRIDRLRRFYTVREATALLWYTATNLLPPFGAGPSAPAGPAGRAQTAA